MNIATAFVLFLFLKYQPSFVTAVKAIPCEKIGTNLLYENQYKLKSCSINKTAPIDAQNYIISEQKDDEMELLQFGWFLTDSKIQFLPIKIAETFPNLLVLDATFNVIESITRENFAELRKMKNLDLYNNKISQIYDGTFDDLASIEKINLGENQIAYLNAVVFQGLSKLKIVSLIENVCIDKRFDTEARMKRLDRLVTSKCGYKEIVNDRSSVLGPHTYRVSSDGSYDLELNAKCVSPVINKFGTCKFPSDCVTQYAISDLSICSFKGKLPVVCCPNQDLKYDISIRAPVRNRDLKRVSQIKCEELSLKYQSGCYGAASNGESVDAKTCPHMARIGHKNANQKNFFCGGSLISENFVLSAAHCKQQNANIVRLGESDDYPIDTFIIHPEYDSLKKHNDISLIKLVELLRLGYYIRPACLDQGDDLEGEIYAVYGYGQTSFGGPNSEGLVKITLETIDNEDCDGFYKPDLKIIPSQICAHDAKKTGQDSCPGDSGGPIQDEEQTCSNNQFGNFMFYKIHGIVSYGIFCGTSTPGVYTRVHSYLDWIEENVWPESNVKLK